MRVIPFTDASMDTTMKRGPAQQGCLFEEDYLLRTLGPIAHSSDVALTELVANAWDAGARTVEIKIPDDFGDLIIVKDDGSGMTPDSFIEKWMTLGYDRVKHQGPMAEFPPERHDWKRPAYGRNGIGRHGMLCFASTYEVESRRDGTQGTFVVSTSTGRDPFVLLSQEREKKKGHGTLLKARITRNLPLPDRVRQVLAARFLHDPRFEVSVNGRSVPLAEHSGLIDTQTIKYFGNRRVQAYFIDSTKAARTTQYQGVAFWVGGRLVGEPAWSVGSTVFLDGRTRIAKRYSVVIKSEDLFDEVTPDWSGFQRSEKTQSLFEAVAQYVESVYQKLSTERVQETTESVIREHREKINSLKPSARLELSEFMTAVTHEQPTIQHETLSSAVKAVINIERSRSGAALLEKLSKLSDEDIDALDRLLNDWTVRDAMTVLDEIDRRLIVVEAVAKLSSDQKVDELHALHPLVTEARWLFGHQFDSPEFASNLSLRNAMQIVFKKHVDPSSFTNPRQRADLIVLSDATLAGFATEQMEEGSGLMSVREVLLIELKRGDSEIIRDHMNQATDYLEEILRCGAMDGRPFVHAFVVGHRVNNRIEPIRSIGENPTRGKVHATTYGQLVRTAQSRLFRLREKLTSRYDDVKGSDLLERVLREPYQMDLKDLNSRPQS
jgi:hypothetical protein